MKYLLLILLLTSCTLPAEYRRIQRKHNRLTWKAAYAYELPFKHSVKKTLIWCDSLGISADSCDQRIIVNGGRWWIETAKLVFMDSIRPGRRQRVEEKKFQ